ncbi:hypothetical protein BaRGS_00037182, partial [Batillaria attramentaria]
QHSRQHKVILKQTPPHFQTRRLPASFSPATGTPLPVTRTEALFSLMRGVTGSLMVHQPRYQLSAVQHVGCSVTEFRAKAASIIRHTCRARDQGVTDAVQSLAERKWASEARMEPGSVLSTSVTTGMRP